MPTAIRTVHAILSLLVLLVEIAADIDDDPPELGTPGRSLGIPACNGAVNDFACHRTDSPVPPDICVQRDPDDMRRCLQTQKVYNYEDTGLPPLPNRGRVDQKSSGSCDAGDPTCIPDGIHKSMDIDWSQVEGADSTVLSGEGTKNIFVNSDFGSDVSGRGTRESPLKSTRAALRKWLYPGKCAPYCSFSAFTSSAVIHLAPGIYFGDDNSNIEILLSGGAEVAIQFDFAYASTAGEYGRPYTRKSGSEIRPQEGKFWLKASGKGTLALKGLSVSNTSSDAILTPPSISLVTDLHFSNGRSNMTDVSNSLIAQTVDSSGNIVRSANWITGKDQRLVGKDLSCDRSTGCEITGNTFDSDARLQGPLPASRSLCSDCWVPVPPGWTGSGGQGASGAFGLGVRLSKRGESCANGGTLFAKFVRSGLPGSGFSAAFSVRNTSVAAVELLDPGSGYVDAEHVTVEIESGGEGCTGLLFTPYLVFDSSFPRR